MKKMITMLFSALLLASVAIAAPVGDDVRTAGNTGFTSWLYDDITGELNGWVRYSLQGSCLQTTWQAWDLVPGEEYQLKVHSKGTDTRLADVTNDTALSGTHFTGDSYLVMDIRAANPTGHVGGAVRECRLPQGEYDSHFFVVTSNPSPWESGSTYVGNTLSEFVIG